MATLDKRVSALETARGKQGLFSNPAINALMTDLWTQAGTSYAQQVAQYGSDHAMLTALDADIQTIINNRKGANHGNT